MVKQPAVEGSEPAPVRAEPVWDSTPQPGGKRERSQVAAGRVDPFDGQVTAVQPDAAARQEMVHKQAEYLRKIMVNGRLPAGLGHLTKEQVDEMEKKGIMIE